MEGNVGLHCSYNVKLTVTPNFTEHSAEPICLIVYLQVFFVLDSGTQPGNVLTSAFQWQFEVD